MKTMIEMEAAVAAAEVKHAAANAEKTALWDAAVAAANAAGLSEHDGDVFWSAVEKTAGAAYIEADVAAGAAFTPVLEFLPQVREAREDREQSQVRNLHGPASDYGDGRGSGYGMNSED